MKNKNQFSYMRLKYLKKIKREKSIVTYSRIIILFSIILLWEAFAYFGIIDAFISSSPSRICLTIRDLFINDNLLYHIFVTLYETLLGFFIAVFLGYVIALMLWWYTPLKNILEPYIVVLNSLPKIALGPIIIVWF